jgi:acyl-CoA thioester hydrolase
LLDFHVALLVLFPATTVAWIVATDLFAHVKSSTLAATILDDNSLHSREKMSKDKSFTPSVNCNPGGESGKGGMDLFSFAQAAPVDIITDTMPMIHQRNFRVRHHECDANGRAHAATYLNFMQEAAFDASAAAGYDFSRYSDLNLHWLVRETDITYLKPKSMRYDASVQVKTWVIDFRRVRSRRAYEFSLDDSTELLAQASTDWVLLDSATGRPTQIPPEMRWAFFPQGPPETAPRRNRYPSSKSPQAGAFQLHWRIRWSDLDSVGHVNNAVYLSFLEDAAISAATENGWPPARLHERELDLVNRRHQIEYRQPAFLDDELVLTTWLSNLDRSTGLRHFTITRPRDNTLLLRARLTWGLADLETGEPVLIPSDLAADLAPHLSGQ